MKLRRIGQAIVFLGGMISIFSATASADTLYLIYKSNDGGGRLSLVYESVQECETATNRPCVLSEVVCGGYKFATVKTSYLTIKDVAKSWNGDWRISVGKNVEDAQTKYDAAEKSNFEIKLCERKLQAE